MPKSNMANRSQTRTYINYGNRKKTYTAALISGLFCKVHSFNRAVPTSYRPTVAVVTEPQREV